MAKGKGSLALIELANKTWAKYFKEKVQTSDAAKTKRQWEELLKERALKTQRNKKELTASNRYILQRAYRRAELDYQADRPKSPRKPAEKHEAETEPDGQPEPKQKRKTEDSFQLAYKRKKEPAVEKEKELGKRKLPETQETLFDEALATKKKAKEDIREEGLPTYEEMQEDAPPEIAEQLQELQKLASQMNQVQEEMNQVAQDVDVLMDQATEQSEQERATRKKLAQQRRHERRLRLKEMQAERRRAQATEELPSYEEMEGEETTEPPSEHGTTDATVDETIKEEPVEEMIAETEDPTIKEEPIEIQQELPEPVVDVTNVVKEEEMPLPDTEEPMPDVSQGLQTADTTNGTAESLTSGETPEGHVQGSTVTANDGPQNTLSHYPGDTAQENYSISTNAQPTLPDNPDVPIADAEQMNAKLQEFGQPMDIEAQPSEEEQKQSEEQILQQTNEETIQTQTEIALDPNLVGAQRTVEKAMDGIEYMVMTYFGQDLEDDPEPIREERMPQAKPLPKTKLPPAEGKMDTSLTSEERAAEKERIQADQPRKMEDVEFTGVGGQRALISQETKKGREGRLTLEHEISGAIEQEEMATSVLDPKRGKRRVIYYDPNDSSVYVTLPSGPTPEVTRNPFEVKPDFQHFKTPEEARMDAKRRVYLEKVAHQKDFAMQQLEFFTRGSAGTEYQRQNLRQAITTQRNYWKMRHREVTDTEKIKEYEASTMAQKEAILEKWRKEDKLKLDEERRIIKALRAARDIEETNDFMQSQFALLQKDFSLENANKRFLYPSLVDRNSRNVIEFAKDEKGNLLRDPVTGGPIITSSWAVERDDAERLRQQRAVADGLIHKKPYFPVFGKAAKKFFSKAEYCQLARMMGNDGQPYPEVIMRTEKAIDKKLDRLYNKLKKTMNLPPIPQDESRRKILLELQTLEQAFAQYSTSVLYDYPNTLDQADRELAEKEQFESAIATLEKITMGQMLQQLAERKAEEIEERNKQQDLERFYEEGRQMNAQERFPTFSNQPGKTAVYTGVGRNSDIANPAQPPPDEEAVASLSNFMDHKPDDQGQEQRQAEAKFQYADPIQGLDLDVSAPSSGIPGHGLQLPQARETGNRIAEPSTASRRRVNPMGQGGFGGEEKLEERERKNQFLDSFPDLYSA